jgi:catechol 2,3-dioxygenase-like lactoylglutathione lyase family enzyme
MIEGLSHITLIVEDLVKTSELLKYVFGAEEVYSSGEKHFSLIKEKFLMVGGIWVAVMEGGDSCPRTYNHIAFKIDEKDYDTYLKRIKELGLEIKPQRNRIAGEGKSIYFYDYDNHLFELHTGTLEERLKCYESSK